MVSTKQVRLYTVPEALASIKSFEGKQEFMVKSGNSRFRTLYDYNEVMAPLVLQAKLLLKLQYPEILFNYIDPESCYTFFAYNPVTHVYFDYFESPWHRGPYGITRAFDPGNKYDLAFVKKFSDMHHSRYSWMYRAKALTWGGSDYRKGKYMQIHHKSYLIYWSMSALQSSVDVDVVKYAQQLMVEQMLNMRLQDVYDRKLAEFIEFSLDINVPALRHYTMSKVELYDTPLGILD